MHGCAVTTSGVGYCWGDNTTGQLGNGSNAMTGVPLRIAGGLSLASVHTGFGYSCGLTRQGAAYCWGSNYAGKLGTGRAADSPVPVPVAGGLTFRAISTGAGHA